MKKKTPAQLKKELDKYFSLFIRLRDSNKEGFGNCYTCGKNLHYKQVHCGHWIPRNILITRWNENNCKFQCAGCNLFGNGKPLDFEEHLRIDLGDELVDTLRASRFQIFKIDSIWYEKKISYYKSECEKMLPV